MLRLLKIVGTTVVLGVVLLRHPHVCWAAETTAAGAAATLYAGGGTLIAPNNESFPDEYQVARVGIGVGGVLHLAAPDANGTPVEPSGFFMAADAAFELEHSLRSVCSYDCAVPDERYLAKHLAARVGVGYSFPAFEFRAGVVGAFPDAHVDYALPFILPDVVARFGRRSRGWFEIGLGAYSASTTFRPGLYLGGALGSLQQLQVSAHAGLHLVNGYCCETVFQPGLAAELGVAHAFSSTLTGSVGAALFAAPRYQELRFVAEGSARLAFAF